MKKIILKYGGMLAALAMVFTTLTVNSTCTWMTYQEELPDTAKKLRKFRCLLNYLVRLQIG